MRRVRILVCCDSAGLAAELAQLRDSTLPRLAELLQRRDIALDVTWSAEESEDPGAQLQPIRDVGRHGRSP
jgi:hypothetical protein